MGTGWRRAFCTTVPRERETEVNEETQRISSPSPRRCVKLRFFTGGSNPSTPRLTQSLSSTSLQCRTTNGAAETPTGNEGPKKLFRSKTMTPRSSKSSPTSPRSPLKLSLFRNSFKFRSSCGICLNSVKAGQGTAIYTAECSHSFHFPCIADNVRKHNTLLCPVCNTTWKDVPLLAAHKNLENGVSEKSQSAAILGEPTPKHTIEDKRVIESSSPSIARGGFKQQSKSSISRSYDDDEPLLTPRFVPIPEADENNEEDEGVAGNDEVEEFQGFAVNPSSSFTVKSDRISSNGRDFKSVQLRIMPKSAIISVGRGYETYAVAIRVKAPPPEAAAARGSNTPQLLEPSQRAPIDLVTVLDLSMSMAGAKLQMLKRAMRLVSCSLGSADRLSIVALSSSPTRLLPLRRMTAQGQRSARRVVDRLVCGTGSSAGDALRKAAKVLEDRREKNPVASIILLSDGQDENQTTNQRQTSNHVSSSTRFAHVEVPVHASGFGESGDYSHEPAEDTFAKCVGRLLSVVVQDLRIQISVSSGSSPCEISAVYLCGGNPTVVSSGSVRPGDLYAGEERELLVELRVPASSSAGPHHVLTARCLYKDPSTQEFVYGRDQTLLVPRPHAVQSSALKIGRLRDRFVTTRAVAESRRLAEHGDFDSAYHLLISARALLMQADSEYVRGVEAELAEIQWRRGQRDNTATIIGRLRESEREREMMEENGEELTPTSAWKAAEKLAKVAMMKKSSKVGDLHGFENARF